MGRCEQIQELSGTELQAWYKACSGGVVEWWSGECGERGPGPLRFRLPFRLNIISPRTCRHATAAMLPMVGFIYWIKDRKLLDARHSDKRPRMPGFQYRWRACRVIPASNAMARSYRRNPLLLPAQQAQPRDDNFHLQCSRWQSELARDCRDTAELSDEQ